MRSRRGTLTQQGNPWTPVELLPRLWLDDTSILATGTAITKWKNRGVYNGGYLLTTTSPVKTVAGLNAKDIATFAVDPANDRLIGSVNFFPIYTDVSYAWQFIVYKEAVSNANDECMFAVMQDDTSNNRTSFLSGVGGAASRMRFGSRRAAAAGTFSGVTSATARSNVWVMALGINDFAANTVNLYVDGVLDGTVTAAWSGTSGNTPNTLSTSSHVGAYNNDSGDFAGPIAELISNASRIGGATLAASDIDKLFGYAAHKWGLTANLPTNHPYKNVPPDIWHSGVVFAPRYVFPCLRLDSISSAYATGTWNDGSMCETNYTQATAGNRPTYNATGVGGLPSLDFDGNDWLDAPATALGIFCEVEQAWVLAVYKHGVADVVTTERPIAFWTNNSTPTRVCLFASPTGEMNKPNIGGRRLDADAFGGVTATAALATNEECILLGYLNFSARTAQLYKNGVLDASATGLWSAGGATSNTVSTRARIGGNGTVTTPSTFLNGKVANIAAGASVLNASQIDKLFGWAAHRHALTGLLPSDHPYKTVPPMVS